jgi:hypothetical protein
VTHNISLYMDVVECLEHSLRICERSKDYEYMKDLMTCADDIKLSSKPSFGYLVEVSYLFPYSHLPPVKMSPDLECVG